MIEWDRYCCDTIRENKARGVDAVKRWKLTAGDVRDVDFGQYKGRVQLVSGGPPCQPFSLGGKHRAHKDARDMFPEAIRAVREARPRAFIFENVKGLTRAGFRNYFEYIRLQLEHPEIERGKNEAWADHHARLEKHYTSGSRSGLCYRLVTQVVNAADYGIPQRRERVFFVGYPRRRERVMGLPVADAFARGPVLGSSPRRLLGTAWRGQKASARACGDCRSRAAHEGHAKRAGVANCPRRASRHSRSRNRS